MSLAEGLKPCPFCGEHVLSSGRRTIGHGESEAYICCTKCNASMPESWDGNETLKDKWNKRVAVS